MDYIEVIRLVNEKDRSGLEALYNSYGEKLYNYAIHQWFFKEDEAWEMVYKTLETLLLKLPGYSIQSSEHFNNLIFKIFKNYLKQFYRNKRSKEGKIEFIPIEESDDIFDEETELEFSINSNAFDDYYKNEVLENPLFSALKVALERLDPTDKELLLLRAQNFSYDEIAVMLKIENKQLKVKHHRAKQKVIDHINKLQKRIL